MNVESGAQPPRTVSAVRKSRWPGWIWAVPLAALGIVIWLMVRELSTHGFQVIVTFEDATGIKAKSTKVRYRGVEVGEVDEVALSADRRHAEVQLSIHDELKGLVNSGTRFYLEGTAPSLSDLSSLTAIVSGPTLVMTPGLGAAQRRFIGIAGRPLPRLAVSIPYLATFVGAAGNLKPGAPVTLQGFDVGEVDHSELSTDAQTGSPTTTVVLLLDPTRFHIHDIAVPNPNWTDLMNATLSKLVERSLRARLTQNPPLVGASQIELAMSPGAEPASLTHQGRYLKIPSVEGGGIADFAQKLGRLPIRRIGENVQAITEQVKQLSSSPQLKASIRHLDRALAEADAAMQRLEPEIAPTMDSVHHAADSLRDAARKIDATSASARNLIGANPASPNGGLEQTLHELEGAARAIRALADYLDQHPEALIKGRAREEPIR